MKKTTKIASLLIGIFLFQASAQAETFKDVSITGGVKAEANLSGFILSGMPDVKSKMNIGATAGGFLNWSISEHFAIRGELLYHYKSSNFTRGEAESKYQYLGMEVPIYAVFQQTNSRDGHYYIGFGPYTEFGLSAKIHQNGKTIVLYKKNGDETDGISALYDSNSGFGIIIGYEFACRLQVNTSYKLSITNVLNNADNSDVMLPVGISLGLGYRFGKR
jgi:hypothetical protein